MNTKESVIETLGLIPLEQEGGLFKSTYQKYSESGELLASAIYYMLDENSFSHLHRLPADELYHFYLGEPVELLELFADGSHRITALGGDLANGQQVQYLVKAGVWQGLRLAADHGFALMGTTMTPGYQDSDYEHAENSADFINRYPDCAAQIRRVTAR